MSLKDAIRYYCYACGLTVLVVILAGGKIEVTEGILTWLIKQILELFM